MYEDELTLAKKAALAAGEMLKNLDERTVESEDQKDIKLAADKLSEKVIMESYLYQDGHRYDILSEERGVEQRENHTHTWVVDPLDGSANFARCMDELCCVSVALWKNGDRGMPLAPVLGVIYRFATDELYSGIVGMGAWKNGLPITTSAVIDVEEAILATGFPVFRDYTAESLTDFVRNVQRFKKIRMLGTAAIMGVLVAEGKIDAYMEDEIMLWDIAASSAIVKAAGGVADIQLFADNKTICRLFANENLAGTYYTGE